jgi:hypothetical protein
MKTARARTLFVAALALTVPGPAANANPARPSEAIGRVDVSTVPFDADLVLRSATYTPSGKVLVSYTEKGADPKVVKLAVMDDDGRNMRTFFSQAIPAREKDNGLRYMAFPDNKRVFLGDFVVECAPSLDACDRSALYPVEYPAEVASGDHIAHRWSEMIVAPDNRHVAWTTLLANYSAVVLLGEIARDGAAYRIARPQIISTLDPFRKDPAHADGVLPEPIKGGEVKQFVHGGTAISVVGAVDRDTPDSVVQNLRTGRKQAITDTPGYTETTIFSPDEQLGLTMTTRFSEKTDPAILGLLPRPYPDSLNMGLPMFAYTYAVTGVRDGRPGNVGPALIDIRASNSQPGYQGIDLSSKDDWVYYSPMSWHPGSTKAMWMEGRRGDRAMRIRILRLPDRSESKPVAARPTPTAIPYAQRDLSVIPGYANAAQNIQVKVYGRKSGYITYRRTPAGLIEKTYAGFSDDGISTWSGRERMEANPRGRSTYTAKVNLSGPKPGAMDLKITFGPLGGRLPSEIVFAADDSGVPLSHGYAEYGGARLSVDELLP